MCSPAEETNEVSSTALWRISNRQTIGLTTDGVMPHFPTQDSFTYISKNVENMK